MARVTPQGTTEGGRDLRDNERMHSSDTTRNAASPIDRPGRRAVCRRISGTTPYRHQRRSEQRGKRDQPWQAQLAEHLEELVMGVLRHVLLSRP